MNRIVAQLRCLALVMVLAWTAACSRDVDVTELRSMVGDSPVVLMSTSTCGYCRELRHDLQKWGIAYTDFDVETSEDGMRAFELVNGRGVPILLIGDQLVHGYSPKRARELLLAAQLLPES